MGEMEKKKLTTQSSDSPHVPPEKIEALENHVPCHVLASKFNRVVSERVNTKDTLDFRIRQVAFTKNENGNKRKIFSLWHDLPLYCTHPETNKPTGKLKFICEIPRTTRKKYEIATDEPGNPIKQDQKNGNLREFMKGDIFFNYGCFPQTWEDPDHIDPEVGVGGDNDPLDACEIGLSIIPTGEVRRVKVLGVLCLIDDGEADWKVICIDERDRWAPELDDVDDLERLLPGTIARLRDWFRCYKVPEGKGPNAFALGGRALGRRRALAVVARCHAAWGRLVAGQGGGARAARLATGRAAPAAGWEAGGAGGGGGAAGEGARRAAAGPAGAKGGFRSKL